MPRRLYTFTVEGTGMFPVDMLRRDECWPKTEQNDSPEILSAPRRTDDSDVAKQARRVIKALGGNTDLMREVLHQLLEEQEHRLWDKPRQVTLTGRYAPNEGRWRSFGWKVVGTVERT